MVQNLVTNRFVVGQDGARVDSPTFVDSPTSVTKGVSYQGAE